MTGDLLDAPDVARLTGKHRSTIWLWANSGRIPPAAIVEFGRVKRFRRDVLEATGIIKPGSQADTTTIAARARPMPSLPADVWDQIRSVLQAMEDEAAANAGEEWPVIPDGDDGKKVMLRDLRAGVLRCVEEYRRASEMIRHIRQSADRMAPLIDLIVPQRLPDVISAGPEFQRLHRASEEFAK